MRNEIKPIVAGVQKAIERAGRDAWLVAYDINGIQQLVTASNRPITMRGASRTIEQFDSEQGSRELAIFAGGGRGYELTKSAKEATHRINELQGMFCGLTVSGVLAAAAVPYDHAHPKGSLTWLRRKLDNAKDAAYRPGGVLPYSKEQQCEDCYAMYADRTITAGEDRRRVCVRCDQFIKHARGNDPAVKKSLLDYANGETRRVAAVSADGNNMGALFGMLETLEQMAVVSSVVAQIFQSAHDRAVGSNDERILAPVTGGDDIRAFMAPELVLGYVEALARNVEDSARGAGNLEGVLSSPELVEAFGNIGIGIGAVVACDHHPASELLEHAHALERRAKAICRDRNGPRSGFDFAILMSEDPEYEQRKVKAISMERTGWARAIHAANALRQVPSTQRAILGNRCTISSVEEFDNLLRYQVARSKQWQQWFEACDVTWTNPVELREHIAATRLDLLDLLATTKDTNS